MKCTCTLIPRLLLTVLLSLTAIAAEQTDFLVNDDGGLTQQTNPRIAVSDGNGFVITWVDRRGETADVYVQRYDTAGLPVGNNIRITDDTTASYQFAPAVSANLSGLYAFCWTDYREGDYPLNPNISCMIFDIEMQSVCDELNLTQTSSTSQKEAADISLSPYGGGVAVWSDYRNGNWDIYGQMIADDGSAVGGNFRIDDDNTASQQHAPRVSVSSGGWFVVTWYDNRWGNDDIFFQMYDADGNKVGVNIKVNTDGAGARQAFPDVACDGNGRFTLVWVDWRNGTYPSNPDIYSCRYDTALVSLTGNLKINTDNSYLAQREPAIAADRMGNVAIVWADSSSTSWDIIGQMIDVDGVVQETNFRANSFSDSLQIRPDVALDGRFRYITWTDKRNGNFDIYASVTQYNDPALAVLPSSMTFEMAMGGSVPSEKTFVVDHVGYNPLDFSVIGGSDWAALSATVGITPESLTVSITTDTLPAGSYLTTYTFIDASGNDSSATLTVRLDVTATPVLLTVSPDTLYFTVEEDSQTTQTLTFDISFSPDSLIDWSAAISANWLTLSDSLGVGSATISATIDADGFDTGQYIATIDVSAIDADKSPESVLVVLDVMPEPSEPPELSVSPASFLVSSINYQNIDTFLVVSNVGGGVLVWSATPDDPWITIQPDSGGSGDTVWISLDTTLLSPGTQVTQISIVDTAASNDSVSILFVVEVIEQPDLSVEPDSLFLQLPAAGTVDTFCVVGNSALGILNWQAQSDSSWLQITPSSGSDGDTIYIAVADTGQESGVYLAHIQIMDSTALTPLVSLPVVVDRLTMPTVDTVAFSDVQAATGESGHTTMTLSLSRSISKLFVPLSYDTSLIRVDSVAFSESLPDSISGSYVIDNLNGFLSISLIVDSTSELQTGHHNIARVMFTTGYMEGEMSLTAFDSDSLQAYIISDIGDSSNPEVMPGTIVIAAPTAVESDAPPALPSVVTLSQNYPNPFNLGTVIEFEIPQSVEVKLEVFNILGQRLVTLVSDFLSPGIYRESWNGKSESGRDAPTGIYFYRLRAGGDSFVRKMALIK